METNLLLTAKLNLVSGIAIGVTAAMIMKKMCERNQCKKRREAHAPAATSG